MAVLSTPLVLSAVATAILSYVIRVALFRSQRDIPGPYLAALTNLWLLYQCRRGRRYLAVDQMHKKYGKVVAIQPNHFSIADIDAIQAIYGHGNGFIKSDFYDAFAGAGHRSIFNTRSRAEHSRKRRAVAHIFSAKSVGGFEQYIRRHIRLLVSEWTNICRNRARSDGYARFDTLPWCSYLAFDITGDLAFGAPFGMLSRGQDLVNERQTFQSDPTCVAAIETLNRQGDMSAALGCLPKLKPYSKLLPDPFFQHGSEAFEHMSGIAIERVRLRLDPAAIANNTRVDMLARIMESIDGDGNELGNDEIITEALTFLVAGSNSTAITLATMLHCVASTPGVMERLQAAIDEVVPAEVEAPSYDMVKHIPYLDCVIRETLRFHSAFSLGLPRQIPSDGSPVEICGKTFYPGDVLSVPIYTMHHDNNIWGQDADTFNPDRWEPSRLTPEQKTAYMPFSVGSRACIGRNLAEMELHCIVSAMYKNFDFKLDEIKPLEYSDGFVRKPPNVRMGIRRRGH